MQQLKLLDLFCGGGGAGMGYNLAGFDVTGVDIEQQPFYPFKFIKADAFEFLIANWQNFDVIHASPKCQKWSTITKTGTNKEYPDQVTPIRELLQQFGKPYIIENVVGAPLQDPVILCGTMFELNIIRHRKFETSFKLTEPPKCYHVKKVIRHGRRPDRAANYAAATGHFSDVPFVQEAMKINWLGQKGLAQAIPPAYTYWIGKQIISTLTED